MKRYIGVAWYPELWPEDVWHEDIRKMKEAGVNLVRVGEFAWSCLEPHEGGLRPEALLPAVQLAISNGLDVVMCTPTATPPIWLSHGHPERMHVDQNGVRMSHGGRQHLCFDQEVFQERAARVAEAIGAVYGEMPGIVAWQLDNELMGNVAECFCEDCIRRWSVWLERTYGTIEALNDAWGTGVWSQSYECFEQVPAPRKTPAGQNPSLVTAYRRFQQDEAATFIARQADILRRHSTKPITLNSSLNHYIDHPATFKALDFAAFDHYSHSTEPHRMRFFMDIFKTLKPDRPWWVMETAPSYCGNWLGHMPLHEAGYLAAEAAQAWAMGAQTFSLWLWRQQRSGSEMAHGSVLQAWGVPSPGFDEVKRTSSFLRKLTPVLEDSVPMRANIALLWSDRARAFFRTEPLEGGCATYAENIGHWHRLLFEAGCPVDGVFPDNPLDDYDVLLTPFLPDVPESIIHNGRRLMARGGTWICGPLSGIRTAEHTVPTGHALGAFGEAFDVPPMMLVPLSESGTQGAAMGMTSDLGWFSALVEEQAFDSKPQMAETQSPESWSMLGRTISGPVSGMAFLMERSVGRGRLILLGSMPIGVQGDAMLTALMRQVMSPAAPGGLPSGIKAIPRTRKNGRETLWILVNVTGEPIRWIPEQPVRNLFDGQYTEAGTTVLFRPFDVCAMTGSDGVRPR